MPKKKHKYWDEVIGYASGIRDGTIIANTERKQMAERFFRDLENPAYEISHKAPEFCIGIIERTMKHQQGESLDGTPLRGTPLKLQPFQKFIIYNLLGFMHAGTNKVRFHEALIMIPRKNGKALALDTEIPTPDGWKQMKDICVGDYIFGKDGKPHKVIGESEIFSKPMYEVQFEDGEVIKASADHIWTVQTKDSRRTSRRIPKRKMIKPDLRETGGWFDTTTAEMAKDYKYTRPDGAGSEYKYRVPMNGPIEYPEKDLPIDPYTLGVWVGDGTSSSCNVTCSDADKDEMMALLQKEGHICRWRPHKDRAGTITIDSTDGQNGGKKNPFLEALRPLNLIKNKHIPEIYLHASVEQRLALLQGLMDTDGTCEKAGQCVFTQKDKRIAESVMELAASLGIKAKMRERNVACNGKPCGKAYYVSFFTDKSFPCFRLKRKAERLKDSLAPRMKAKSIVRIAPIPNEPSKCIAIDSEDHLYLAGRHYTVTHNTSFAAALAWALSLWYRRSGSKCYITSAALMQSLESFNFLKYNIKEMGEDASDGGKVKIIDNNNEHSMEAELSDGSFFIRALAANPDRQDSLNCNIAIADRHLSPASATVQ